MSHHMAKNNLHWQICMLPSVGTRYHCKTEKQLATIIWFTGISCFWLTLAPCCSNHDAVS